MSTDSEVISVSEKEQPAEMSTIFTSAFSKVPAKLLVMIFVIYMFLSSDVFTRRVLGNIDNAVGYNDVSTTKGTLITGVLLVLFVGIVQILITQKVI